MGLIPQHDEQFLAAQEFSHELRQQGSELHLILKQLTFPKQYALNRADVLIIIPAGYPNAGLDMFWTHPDVKLLDGSWPQAGDHHQQWGDRIWQRWSRHYEWRGGVDNLRTFITSLQKEIGLGI